MDTGRLPISLCALVLFLLGTAATAAAQADRRIEVYRVQYRTAEELAPLARTVLAPAGTAVVDSGTNSVVLVGPAEDVEAALGLLRGQDQRLRTVVLRFAARRAADLERLQIRVEWSVGNDFWRVGTSPFPVGQDGLLVAGAWTQETNASAFTGAIRVLEGTEAQIASRTESVLPSGRRHRPPTFVAEESGLIVLPRVLGDGRILVELSPLFEELGADGAVRSTGATTEMIVEPGSTVVVGSAAADADRAAYGAPELRQAVRSREETVLLLTVEVE